MNRKQSAGAYFLTVIFLVFLIYIFTLETVWVEEHVIIQPRKQSGIFSMIFFGTPCIGRHIIYATTVAIFGETERVTIRMAYVCT